MSKDWLKSLGWGEDQLNEMRLAGYAYIRQGKYDIAKNLFEALCVLDPNSAYNSQTLGALYLQVNNPIKALKFFDRALKAEADHTPTLLNLTKALFMVGKKEEAIKLCKILKNEPNLAISNMAKALILAFEKRAKTP